MTVSGPWVLVPAGEPDWCIIPSSFLGSGKLRAAQRGGLFPADARQWWSSSSEASPIAAHSATDGGRGLLPPPPPPPPHPDLAARPIDEQRQTRAACPPPPTHTHTLQSTRPLHGPVVTGSSAVEQRRSDAHLQEVPVRDRCETCGVQVQLMFGGPPSGCSPAAHLHTPSRPGPLQPLMDGSRCRSCVYGI